MNARVERLRGELDRLGARTFLVTAPVNVFWLTGFESSNAALLVTSDDVKLVTDGRYISASPRGSASGSESSRSSFPRARWSRASAQ